LVAAGGEIPAEQNQQTNAGKKCDCGIHRNFDLIIASTVQRLTLHASLIRFVIADFSISSFTLSATFTITVVSLTLVIIPRIPDAVTTWSPVFNPAIRRCCSFCRRI